MTKFILSLLILLGSLQLFSQTVYEHISNSNIYVFLDEMANDKLIELNDVIKPYSRLMIYGKLEEVQRKTEANGALLNKRQLKELKFYLLAYNMENRDSDLLLNKYSLSLNKRKSFALLSSSASLSYKDSIFKVSAQPIYGATYSKNANGDNTHTWGGLSLFGSIGKHLAFYTSVRDNNESQLIMKPKYFVQTTGAPIKNFGASGVDYNEARGGITYSGKWGSIGLIKDNIQWGLGYNGTNIQSGHTPSFAMIKLQLKPTRWFEFNYYHASLVSEVIDSTNSYITNGTYRVVNYPKYMAANMFTLYPFKNFNFSFGNSIVYSDVGGGGPHIAYLIPFLFYKSVDHTLNSIGSGNESGQNSQLFFNFSSRNIKHLHLYFTLFMDDLSFSNFFDKEAHNIFSYKGGLRLSNFLIENITLTAEYTLTNPFVFQHKIQTSTYESNSYTMGHYLKDNSSEIYLALQYKPIRGLHFLLSYTLAKHFDDYDIVECAHDRNCNAYYVPVYDNVIWQNQSIFMSVKYEVMPNTYIYGNINAQNITGDEAKIELYSPEYYRGQTNTITVGLNMGF